MKSAYVSFRVRTRDLISKLQHTDDMSSQYIESDMSLTKLEVFKTKH